VENPVEALTLGTVKYGDSSLIAACFTKQYGLQSYILKGILSPRGKKKVFKSLFEPLNLLELEATKNPINRLGYIKEARLGYSYTSIPFDIRKKALIFFLAEIIHQVVKEEPDLNEPLYSFVRQRMIWLDQNDHIGLFPIKTMLDLTKHIGFYPNVNPLEDTYFDLESGCMTSFQPRGSFLVGKEKMHWTEILGMDFDGNLNIVLNKEEKKRLLEHVVLYFKLHLQQFKSPKSTEILNEIFNST
jgi:DNA repair protein RecO (recombination protein O)